VREETRAKKPGPAFSQEGLNRDRSGDTGMASDAIGMILSEPFTL